jgi:hypothetical protein
MDAVAAPGDPVELELVGAMVGYLVWRCANTR